MSSRDPNDLDPELKLLAEKFVVLCANDPDFILAKATVFLTQTYRSADEQDADYAKGRLAPGGIITNARGGYSAHNVVDANGNPASCAFDFGIKNNDGTLDWNADDALWKSAIRIGIGLGLVSGSTWKFLRDNPHMQLYSWQPPSENLNTQTPQSEV